MYRLPSLTLLLIALLSTCGRAQDITVSASIGLAEDQCNPVINDPDADCINVPVGEDVLTYLPGQDGDIIVTYRLTNNSSGTIVQGAITDSDRGVIIPVSSVNIPPGTTVTTNRIYRAETLPRDVTATVTANLENAAGASIMVEGEYRLDVVAPEVDIEFSLVRKIDACPTDVIAADCAGKDYGNVTINVGATDTIVTQFEWTNSGLSTYDESQLVDQDGAELVGTGFDQAPGLTLVLPLYLVAPSAPGTYARSQTITVTDFAGNTATATVNYTIIVEAPQVAVDFSLVRKIDACPTDVIAANCAGRDYGNLTINVGATDTIVTRFEWTNVGLGTFDRSVLTDQDNFQLSSTDFDQGTGQTLILSLYLVAPSLPGTYLRSQTVTVTDVGGNVTTKTVVYTIIVEAPQVGVEFSLVRKKDACPTDVIAPNCTGRDYGNTTLTVGAADTIVTRFDWTNIGLGTFDQSVLTDQDNNPLSNTGFDQETGQTLILSLYLVSPDAPGTYQWSQTVTVTDLGGNTATSTVNYTIIVDCSILDDAPPVARCQDITVDLLPGETATITPQEVNDGSADGCGALAGGTLDLLSFTCADEGANLVTLTVHDLRNNTASCTATVTVAVIEDIYPGRADDCVAGTVPVNTGQAWQDIREPGGQLVAQVIIGGNNNIKNVGGSVFKTDSDLDNLNGTPFVSKRIDLTMLDGALNEVQPASEPVYVRLYYTEAELRALRNVVSGTPPSDFVVVKSDVTDCGPGYEGLNAVGMNATFTALDCNRGGYYEFFTGRFSTFYLFPSEAVLPVELSSFTAHALPKQQAQLNWTTQTETGNSHFVVERSTDGHTFTHLGAVAGAGESSSEKWYTFQDENALAGVNYYRLRQVDFDGTESLSEVRVVTFAGGSDLTVYPNPATGELWLSDFTGGPISVMDAAGREVLSTRLAEGEALPVSHLAPGMYLLRAGEMVVGWVKR